MAKIGKLLNTTSTKLDMLEYGGKPRTYLGMSSIGKECARDLWYGFHWAKIKKHKSQTERTFNAGHMFESMIIAQLKDIGCEVFRVDKDGKEIELFGWKDEEQEEMIGFAGHAKGHSDGRIRGVVEAPKTVHLLELKTMAEKYFKLCDKKGVKESNPVYYGQTQRYMKAKGLTRTLFIAINKNTSEIYPERIDFDKGYADDLVRKEQIIIMAHEPPPRAYPAGFYKCGYCNNLDVCREGVEPEKNCRTCEYSEVEMEGKWICNERKDMVIPEGLQRKGCSKYKKGWEL